MHTIKCTRTVHTWLYTWNVYSKRRLERVYLVQISIYCDLYFSSITHELATILISSFDLAWVFRIKCRHKCVDTALYASDTCSVPCQTAALHELCWGAIFRWLMLYSVLHCIIYSVHVCILQLIINSTMYTIVPVCVLFSNFGDINSVHMYFYPD